jgi:hypothetical protein
MQRPDGLGVRAVEDLASVPPNVDEPNVAEHFQMLRHGRLRELERVDDLVDRPFIRRQEREDVATPGFCNGVEDV